MDQLCRRLIDKGLCGAKEGQGAVGGIDKGRQADGGGEGGREKSRVEAITNEGVPDLKDNIHDGRRGAVVWRGREKRWKGGGEEILRLLFWGGE